MATRRLNPYIFLDGEAEKAISHYERALGAKVETLQRASDVPGMELPPGRKHWVTHSVLRLGEGALMVSDGMGEPGEGFVRGGNVSITLDYDDPQELVRHFKALSKGGKVLHAPHDTFYGGTMAVLTDAFGVNWMFNSMSKRKASKARG